MKSIDLRCVWMIIWSSFEHLSLAYIIEKVYQIYHRYFDNDITQWHVLKWHGYGLKLHVDN
jgi:hypothetical protein